VEPYAEEKKLVLCKPAKEGQVIQDEKSGFGQPEE
jgi:hypothetical protein